MSEFFIEIKDSTNSNSVIIEDDGKVAYAYLLQKGNMIGDVWLYNQAETPQIVNWKNKKEMPFLNPYTTVEQPNPIMDNSEVTVEWISEGNIFKGAKVILRNEVIAVLQPNLYPGFNMLAATDSPLAKVLK